MKTFLHSNCLSKTVPTPTVLKWQRAIRVFQQTFLQIFIFSWTTLFHNCANPPLTKKGVCENEKKQQQQKTPHNTKIVQNKARIKDLITICPL